MKKSSIVAACVAACMGLSAVASFAQGMPPGGPGHDPRYDQGRDQGHDHAPPPHHDEMRAPMHAPPPAGPARHEAWRKGDRLDHEYRDRQYVVDDWRGYGLRQPPRGYQWVGVGGDYLLIAVASGIIAQVVMSR
jgi:Ni/Co efflux regulator RcnB